MSGKRLALSAVLCLLPLLAGCIHKPLCFPKGELTPMQVRFDWSTADQPAEAMRVFFYSADGSTEPIVYDLPGQTGGTVELPEGTYQVAAYNTDTQNILYRPATTPHGLPDLLLSTIPSAIAQKLNLSLYGLRTDSATIYETPDRICRAFLSTLKVSPQEPAANRTVTLFPRECLYRLSYEVHGIQNLRSSISYPMLASLGNVSDGYLIRQGIYTDTPVQMLLPANNNSGTVVGSCSLFGVPQGSLKHLFSLYIYTEQGMQVRTFDVTDQIPPLSPQDHTVHIHIQINTDWSLPEPIGGGTGGGFDPEVEEWEDEEEDLPL